METILGNIRTNYEKWYEGETTDRVDIVPEAEPEKNMSGSTV